MNSDAALDLARKCFPEDTIAKVSLRSRARLWAGMGNIYEVRCTPCDRKMMVKYIHPRLCNKPGSSNSLSIGDQRKLDSYIVEANFYEYFAQGLREDYRIPLPRPLYVERHMEDSLSPIIIICMEELSNCPSGDQIDGDIHTNVVKWLAKFHAATWNRAIVPDRDGDDAEPLRGGVQPIGSYWYLKTRPDEWQDIRRHGWEGRLKKAARAIDARLERDPLQCWVHGDTKDANILYSGTDLAFCDFQYVGRGPPSRDLSYYFCSSHVSDLEEQRNLLDLYYNDLVGYLKLSPSLPKSQLPTRQQLNDSMELAFCDFCRFMAGWGYWGYDLSKQVEAVLDKLDGGKILKSEDDYDDAVRRVFG